MLALVTLMAGAVVGAILGIAAGIIAPMAANARSEREEAATLLTLPPQPSK